MFLPAMKHAFFNKKNRQNKLGKNLIAICIILFLLIFIISIINKLDYKNVYRITSNTTQL